MDFQKKYLRKKDITLNSFVDVFKENDLFDSIGFILNSYQFQNARNEDDYIELIFKKEPDLFLSIKLWIHFWFNYEYNENFIVNYGFIKNDINGITRLFGIDLNFKELEGKSMNDKIQSLCFDIIRQIKKM